MRDSKSGEPGVVKYVQSLTKARELLTGIGEVFRRLRSSRWPKSVS